MPIFRTSCRDFALLGILLAAISCNQESIEERNVAKISGIYFSMGTVTNRAVQLTYTHPSLSEPLLNRIALQSLIEEKALVLKGTKLEIHIGNKEIDAELKRLQNYASNTTAWKDYLSRFNLNEAGSREAIKVKLIRERVLERLAENATITEAKARAFYDGHVSKFTLAKSLVRGRLASIALPPRSRATTRQSARAKLNSLRGKWVKDDCWKRCCKPSCKCEGDETTPDDPEVEETLVCDTSSLPDFVKPAVTGLQLGEVTQVLANSTGFAIFQLTEDRAGTVLPYEKARDDILYALWKEKSVISEQAILKKIICESKPEVYMKIDGKEFELDCND